MAQSDIIFTASLSASNVRQSGGLNIFSIGANNGIRGLSIKWVSGTVLFKGNMSINDIASGFIGLVEGFPFGFSSELAVSGFDIDVTNGVCEIALIK